MRKKSRPVFACPITMGSVPLPGAARVIKAEQNPGNGIKNPRRLCPEISANWKDELTASFFIEGALF